MITFGEERPVDQTEIPVKINGKDWGHITKKTGCNIPFYFHWWAKSVHHIYGHGKTEEEAIRNAIPETRNRIAETEKAVAELEAALKG